MKEINCKNTCKMTSEMRNSKFCTGKARIIDGKIFYGCKEAIASEPVEVKQLMACEIWDAGIKDSCSSCALKCVNNTNPELKKTQEERERLDKLIEELRPNMILYNVTADDVDKISSKYREESISNKGENPGREAIFAANIANEVLKMALNGKPIDPAFLTLFARKTSGRLKKMKKKKG